LVLRQIIIGRNLWLVSFREEFFCPTSISDKGIGFGQKYSEKIFEVFQRLHGKEQYDGTGVGLAIVKKIIENHSGFIKASGEPDIGANFDIYLPYDS
jgi:light-regulated signal transduction histidine kinase (bacteriophytochrome)